MLRRSFGLGISGTGENEGKQITGHFAQVITRSGGEWRFRLVIANLTPSQGISGMSGVERIAKSLAKIAKKMCLTRGPPLPVRALYNDSLRRRKVPVPELGVESSLGPRRPLTHRRPFCWSLAICQCNQPLYPFASGLVIWSKRRSSALSSFYRCAPHRAETGLKPIIVSLP
jgi:hypothetical protein